MNQREIDEIMLLGNHDAWRIDWYRRLIADGTAEDGQRIAVEMYDRAKKLQSENAELKAQLERAVVLPCAEGTKVFAIGKPCRNKLGYNKCGKAFKENGDLNFWCSEECPEKDVVLEKGFIAWDKDYIGKTIFLTREEAEAALNNFKQE